MKKLFTISAVMFSLAAYADTTLSTPHGMLAFKDANITLDGKSIGVVSYGGPINDFSEKTYKLGKKDVYVFTSHSGGSADPEQYHGLVVIEKSKDAKVLEHKDFWALPSFEVAFKIADGKMTADLGARNKKNYLMTYDGTKIEVKGIAPKKGGKKSMKNDLCKNLHEQREDYCEYHTEEYISAFVERAMNIFLEDPGFNEKAFENLCKKNIKKLEKISFKEFKSMVCEQ